MTTAEIPVSKPVPHLEGSAKAALQAMVNRPFLETERYQQQQWRANRKGAHFEIILFEMRLVARMADLGVPMFAHSVVRTQGEQNKVFLEGHSKKDGNAPYAHQRAACDVVHSIHAWNLTRDQWNVIGHVGKEVAKQLGLDVVWGGDWKDPWDPAHWELADWRTRSY